MHEDLGPKTLRALLKKATAAYGRSQTPEVPGAYPPDGYPPSPTDTHRDAMALVQRPMTPDIEFPHKYEGVITAGQAFARQLFNRQAYEPQAAYGANSGYFAASQPYQPYQPYQQYPSHAGTAYPQQVQLMGGNHMPQTSTQFVPMVVGKLHRH